MPAQGVDILTTRVLNRKGTNMNTASSTQSAPATRASLRWRVVDIVTASVIAVAGGVVFWAYGLAWGAIGSPIGALLPGLSAAPAALWLFAGVLGGLVIRKPGAALYTEVVAAMVSAILGSQWGLLTIESGIVQGLGAEIVFALFLYRRWNLQVAMLAGAGAGVAMAINDLILSYPGSAPAFAIIYVISAVIGGALLAGALPWWIQRSLARAGALSRFRSGQGVAVVD